MNTRLLPIAVLALCAVACTNDNENLNDGPVAARFIADIAPATRASGTAWAERDEIGISESRFGYTNVPYRWESGDEIGISESRFGYTNVPYRWESGKFTPTGTIIFFQDDDPTTFSHGAAEPARH